MPVNIIHLTSDGEMLDEICHNHYGKASHEAMLALVNANPWALKIPLKLPANQKVILPPLSRTVTLVDTIKLWAD
jgi:phage tail protein X